MSASENDIRRERARARLAARQKQADPEAAPSEGPPGRSLVRYCSYPANSSEGSQRKISADDLEEVNARCPSSRQRAKQQNSANASFAPGSKLSRGGQPPQENKRSRGRNFPQNTYASRQNDRLRSLLPKALLLLLVLALAVGLVFLGRGCVAKVNEYRAKLAAQNVEPADPETLPKFFEVSAIVGDSLAFQLIEKAVINPDAAWIAANVDEYERFGAADQRKLIRLAAMDSNAIEFVRGYPESFPAESGASGLPTWEGEGVPLYYQYDVRWGFVEYGGQGMGLTGCAPTCLAMVYQHITGNDDKSPYDMAIHARNGGYVTEDIGTYTALFLNGVSSLGLTPHDLPRSAESVTWALQNNGIIVANMTEGDFTEGGHYIVLAGMDADGKVIVNDPFSSVNSAKTWDVDTVVSQSVRMIAYYKG